MAQQRIVVIEDDADILTLVQFNLEAEGYRVTGYRDGTQGLSALRDNKPDLLVLDLMLPGTDGIEICRALQSEPALRQLPIIIISAKGRESDIVLGLGLGADDYLTKPFKIGELVARVRALLRRIQSSAPGAEPRIIEAGPLRIDLDRFEVHHDGQLLALTPTEFKLLHTLAANPGRVFTREMLKDLTVGPDVFVLDHNIDVHIGTVRKKLTSARGLIDTVWGIGYRFKL